MRITLSSSEISQILAHHLAETMGVPSGASNTHLEVVGDKVLFHIEVSLTTKPPALIAVDTADIPTTTTTTTTNVVAEIVEEEPKEEVEEVKVEPSLVEEPTPTSKRKSNLFNSIKK